MNVVGHNHELVQQVGTLIPIMRQSLDQDFRISHNLKQWSILPDFRRDKISKTGCGPVCESTHACPQGLKPAGFCGLKVGAKAPTPKNRRATLSQCTSCPLALVPSV